MNVSYDYNNRWNISKLGYKKSHMNLTRQFAKIDNRYQSINVTIRL